MRLLPESFTDWAIPALSVEHWLALGKIVSHSVITTAVITLCVNILDDYSL